MPDNFHVCRVLGGAAAEIAYNNIPYHQLSFIYSYCFTGWDIDIKQGLDHGYFLELILKSRYVEILLRKLLMRVNSFLERSCNSV